MAAADRTGSTAALASTRSQGGRRRCPRRRRGRDRLVGGEGDDTLWGGKAADVFVYRGAAGDDLIRDFAPGVDRIDLTALGLHGLGQVSQDTTAEGWAVARVRGVEITFHGVTWSELGNEDFIL